MLIRSFRLLRLSIGVALFGLVIGCGSTAMLKVGSGAKPESSVSEYMYTDNQIVALENMRAKPFLLDSKDSPIESLNQELESADSGNNQSSAKPGSPSIISPSQETVVEWGKPFTLKWTKVSGADHYDVYTKNLTKGESITPRWRDGTSNEMEARLQGNDGDEIAIYIAVIFTSGQKSMSNPVKVKLKGNPPPQQTPLPKATSPVYILWQGITYPSKDIKYLKIDRSSRLWFEGGSIMWYPKVEWKNMPNFIYSTIKISGSKTKFYKQLEVGLVTSYTITKDLLPGEDTYNFKIESFNGKDYLVDSITFDFTKYDGYKPL